MTVRQAKCFFADNEPTQRTTATEHELLFTPPYHPELQPIERVWCCVKNEIARNPVYSVTEMDARLWKNFAELVTEKILLSTYRQSKEWEQKYRDGDKYGDTEEEDEEDDDEPSDSDSDESADESADEDSSSESEEESDEEEEVESSDEDMELVEDEEAALEEM